MLYDVCCMYTLSDCNTTCMVALQSPMTIPQIVVEGLTINPDILDLDTAEAAFENFTSE